MAVSRRLAQIPNAPKGGLLLHHLSCLPFYVKTEKEAFYPSPAPQVLRTGLLALSNGLIYCTFMFGVQRQNQQSGAPARDRIPSVGRGTGAVGPKMGSASLGVYFKRAVYLC